MGDLLNRCWWWVCRTDSAGRVAEVIAVLEVGNGFRRVRWGVPHGVVPRVPQRLDPVQRCGPVFFGLAPVESDETGQLAELATLT